MSDLTIVEEVCEPIPLPDVRYPDRMPSLPAWLVLRIESMSDDGGARPMPMLPARLILNPAQRAEIERYVAVLESLGDQTPANGAKWEKAVLLTVTKLMLVLPFSQQNDLGAEATGEAFQTALADIPHWAVAAAVRRWYRGECGLNEHNRPYDYHWRPAPAELRRIAVCEMWRLVKAPARQMRKLLAAEPLVEFSAEHRERMGSKLRALAITLHDVC